MEGKLFPATKTSIKLIMENQVHLQYTLDHELYNFGTMFDHVWFSIQKWNTLSISVVSYRLINIDQRTRKSLQLHNLTFHLRGKVGTVREWGKNFGERNLSRTSLVTMPATFTCEFRKRKLIFSTKFLPCCFLYPIPADIPLLDPEDLLAIQSS